MAKHIARRSGIAPGASAPPAADVGAATDGTHALVHGSDAGLPISADLTVELGIKSSGGAGQSFFEFSNAGATQFLIMQLTSATNVRVGFNGSVDQIDWTISSTATSGGILTLTYNGTSHVWSLWQNGTKISDAAPSAWTSFTPQGSSLYIGGGSPVTGTGILNGTVERASIYDKVLSDARIAAHGASFPGNHAAYAAAVLADTPIRNYAMQEPSGTTCTDTGSQGVNLTFGTIGITLGSTGIFTG